MRANIQKMRQLWGQQQRQLNELYSRHHVNVTDDAFSSVFCDSKNRRAHCFSSMIQRCMNVRHVALVAIVMPRNQIGHVIVSASDWRQISLIPVATLVTADIVSGIRVRPFVWDLQPTASMHRRHNMLQIAAGSRWGIWRLRMKTDRSYGMSRSAEFLQSRCCYCHYEFGSPWWPARCICSSRSLSNQKANTGHVVQGLLFAVVPTVDRIKLASVSF